MALDDLMDINSEDGDDDDEALAGISSSGYEWEIHHAFEGKVDCYLYGLLWNLQTCQDGVFPCYSMTSTTARDYLQQRRTLC